jgi:hypothetical protein
LRLPAMAPHRPPEMLPAVVEIARGRLT